MCWLLQQLDAHQPELTIPVHVLVAVVAPATDKDQLPLLQEEVIQLPADIHRVVAGEVVQKAVEVDLLEQIDQPVVGFGLADPFQVIHLLGEEEDNMVPGVVHSSSIIDLFAGIQLYFF